MLSKGLGACGQGEAGLGVDGRLEKSLGNHQQNPNLSDSLFPKVRFGTERLYFLLWLL